MHCALPVQEALRATDSEHAFVPDVGVNVEPLSSIEAEADKALRGNVVARRCQRHVEGLGVEWEEQLAAVRMIVCVPQHHAARRVGVVEARHLGRLGIGQDVVAPDGLIAAVQDVTSPFTHEHALSRTTLIPVSASTGRLPCTEPSCGGWTASCGDFPLSASLIMDRLTWR